MFFKQNHFNNDIVEFPREGLGDFQKHVPFRKEHHVNMGWEYVNHLPTLNIHYTHHTNTHKHTHRDVHAQPKQPVHLYWPLLSFTGIWVQ